MLICENLIRVLSQVSFAYLLVSFVSVNGVLLIVNGLVLCVHGFGSGFFKGWVDCRCC